MTSTFEDRLLTELRREVHLAAAGDPAPAPRTRRTRLRVATGLAAGAAVAGGMLAFPGGGTAPAYAVERNDDGTVTLRLMDELTVDAAEQAALADELRAAGITVLLDPAADGERCDWPDHGVLTEDGARIVAMGQAAADSDSFVEQPGRPDDPEGADGPAEVGMAQDQDRQELDGRSGTVILEPGNVVAIDPVHAPGEGVRFDFFETDPGPCVPVPAPENSPLG